MRSREKDHRVGSAHSVGGPLRGDYVGGQSIFSAWTVEHSLRTWLSVPASVPCGKDWPVSHCGHKTTHRVSTTAADGCPSEPPSASGSPGVCTAVCVCVCDIVLLDLCLSALLELRCWQCECAVEDPAPPPALAAPPAPL